jgi:membrane protein
MNKITQFIEYFQQEFWNPKQKSKSKNFFHKVLRILFASIRDFIDDKCFDKASTLTFYSLLSIIPLVAIGFGIAQELGFADRFTEQVKAQLYNQPQVAEKIIEFSDSTLKTTKGNIIAWFGFIILLWTVFRMIGNIGSSFDEIWNVKNSLTLWQQVKRYIPMIFLFPIFLVGSSTIIIFMSTKAILAFKSIEVLNYFSPFIEFIFQWIPYLVSWGLLSFIYIYLPNTKVSWKAGIIAGIITGILYVIWQWIYVTFQVNASSYGAIYGGFAALPLFLIWLNYSWLIILFGTELSRNIQEISD